MLSTPTLQVGMTVTAVCCPCVMSAAAPGPAAPGAHVVLLGALCAWCCSLCAYLPPSAGCACVVRALQRASTQTPRRRRRPCMAQVRRGVHVSSFRSCLLVARPVCVQLVAEAHPSLT
jgi:hypothetical protein